MARGAKVFYIESGIPSGTYVPSPGLEDPTPENTQTMDIVISRENGKTWQKDVSGLLWVEISAGRPKDITDGLEMSSDHIINNVTPIRGAHINDFNRILRALQTVSANRYGDRYFNDHNVTDSISIWFTLDPGKIDLKRINNDLKLTLYDSINHYAIGNVAGNFTLLNSQMYYVYVQTKILEALEVKTDMIEAYVQVRSSVLQGTPPFLLTSKTLNVNLNSDLLEGMHAHNTVQEVVDGTPIAADLDGNTPVIPVSNNILNKHLNADMLDGLHLAQVLALMPTIIPTGAAYIDGAGDGVGTGYQLNWSGGTVYFPVSGRADGVCYGRHSKHGSCHWMRMCHSWTKKTEVE